MKLHTMNLAETRTERTVLVVDLEAETEKLAVVDKKVKNQDQVEEFALVLKVVKHH